MTDENKRAEIRKIEEDIRRLEELKQSGALPADLAEASIAALRKQLATYQAKVYGSGAVAQGDGAKAVGKGGTLVEGSFQGNIYIGEQPEDDEQALLIYRRMVMQTTSSLPLRGVDVGASDATRTQTGIGLANVYIDLDTTSAEEQNTSEDSAVKARDRVERFALLYAVTKERKAVILGDPGSGKSTFVNFLAYSLAANVLEPNKNWLEHLKGWDKNEADILPIVVILRDFARAHAENLPQQAEVVHVWDFIESRLNAQNLQAAIKPLKAALESGKAILLFDGLDEVPIEKQRLFVRDAVRVFINRYDGCRYLLTCRVLSYQSPANNKPDLRLNELPSFRIAEFDEEKISQFVVAWHTELVRLGTIKSEESEALTERLSEAVQRPDLTELANNPLLLTVMALVHTHKGRLPDVRALLYEETIEILLWRWEQIKLGEQNHAPSLRQYLMEAGRTDVDLKRVLREIAYQMHSSTKPYGNNNALADIDEHLLVKALATLKRDEQNPDGDWNWARHVVDLMKLRAGLLLEKQPGVFTFPHRTFQEYLAGAYLASQNNFAECATKLTPQKGLWREVILYAVGRLVYVSEDLDKPLALAAELCPDEMEDTDLAWWQTWLAGDVLQEIGINRVNDRVFGRNLLNKVRNRLKDLLEKDKLAPVERNNVGIRLSSFGDPRFNTDMWHLPNDIMLGFILIPAGKFLMGSNDEDKDADSDEKPQHEIDLPDFWMAKYPVTVAQFRVFTEATRYSFKYWKYNSIASRPIAIVSWYDALEYTKWLDKVLRQYAEKQIKAGSKDKFWKGFEESQLHVTLPSEAEWEKAGRGIDGRIYPWGNNFDFNKVNMDETQVGESSTVVCFPAGASPYGLLDMGGNVWEWTRNIFQLRKEDGDDAKKEYRYPYNINDGREDAHADELSSRVLRGGSFDLSAKYVRCAKRRWSYPSSRDFDIGFRVAVVSSDDSI